MPLSSPAAVRFNAAHHSSERTGKLGALPTCRRPSERCDGCKVLRETRGCVAAALSFCLQARVWEVHCASGLGGKRLRRIPGALNPGFIEISG